MAVRPGVADAHDAAIRHPDAARALDLQEIDIDGIIQPREFQAPASDGTGLDRLTGMVDGTVAQFGRATVDRVLETPSADGGAIEFGLEVTGEQSGRLADDDRLEKQLEEAARRGVVLRDIGGDGTNGLPVGLVNQVTGAQEGDQSFGVVVVIPAVKCIEFQHFGMDRRGGHGRKDPKDLQPATHPRDISRRWRQAASSDRRTPSCGRRSRCRGIS